MNMKKLVPTIMLTTCLGYGMSAQASLITETWETSVTSSVNNLFYSIGDKVRWDVTYDDASTAMHEYNDGPDGIAGTVDDTLLDTINKDATFTIAADAVFDFGNIFANLRGAYTDANILTTNLSQRYEYFGSFQYTEYRADSDWLQMNSFGIGSFHNLNDFRGGSFRDSYIEFDNTSIIRTVSAVPEPATLALFGIGLAGLGFSRKKKKSE
jgi:hypothetical protein